MESVWSDAVLPDNALAPAATLRAKPAGALYSGRTFRAMMYSLAF